MSYQLGRRNLTIGLFVFTSFAGLRAEASCGTFGIIKGEVKIESGSTHEQSPAVTGGKICSGDTVIAGKDARAKILINASAPSGKNELNISPDTRLVLENYEFNPADNKKKVLLNILSGKVRATTTPNYYNDKSKDGQANTFEVRTKSAVAGVRGTDFMTSFAPATGQSELVTFSGKVTFGQPGPNGTILNAVSVVAGQHSTVTTGAMPGVPRNIPPSEMKQMDKESKPETATVGANANSGATSAAGDSGKKEKSDSGDRSTASVGGASSGMVDHGDLGGGAINSAPDLGPKLPSIPPSPTVVNIPKCEFCNQAVQNQNQKSKVNVIINFPGK